MQPESLISDALTRLLTYGFTPVFGAEIECYVQLKDVSVSQVNPFFSPIIAHAREENIPLLRIEQERGPMQFELVLGVFHDAMECVRAIDILKYSVAEQGRALGVEISFAGKPYDDAPGSGLHLHLNLLYQGENAFHKTDEYISDALHHALGGLCALTPHVMPILCPVDEGFIRYRDKDHVASTASWGSNNRSCAVRIPYTPAWEDKRIEWRTPAADAVPLMVMALMLHAVACGIDERIEPPAQSYGIATKELHANALPLTMEDAMHKLELLPEAFLPLTPALLRSWLA